MSRFCCHGKKIWLDSKGYPRVYTGGLIVRLHVWVWEQVHGPIPKGMDIHHKDSNKENPAIENLQLVTKSDHKRIHAGWVMDNGDWVSRPCNRCSKILPLSEFYRRPNPPYSIASPCKECMRTTAYIRFLEKREAAHV